MDKVVATANGPGADMTGVVLAKTQPRLVPATTGRQE